MRKHQNGNIRLFRLAAGKLFLLMSALIPTGLFSQVGSSVATAQAPPSQVAHQDQVSQTCEPSADFISRSVQLEMARELSAFQRNAKTGPARTPSSQRQSEALRMLRTRNLESSIRDFGSIAQGVDGLGDGAPPSRSFANQHRTAPNSGALRLLEDRLLGAD